MRWTATGLQEAAEKVMPGQGRGDKDTNVEMHGQAHEATMEDSDSFASDMSATFSDEDFNPSKKLGHVDIAAPEEHNMPWYVMWGSVVLIAIIMALVGWFMALTDTWLVEFKFDIAMQYVMSNVGLIPGVLTLAGISAVFAMLASLLVFCFAPICAGSGVPEAKGYMNGNSIPNLFLPQVLVVRTLAAILAVAAGFPIGREGPMVGIGGQIGYTVVRLLGRPFMKTWLHVQGQDGRSSVSAHLVDERRFGYAKRVGYVVGAAAGIAVAFKAPIGGILYLLQEATVTSWSHELTAKAFICTVLCVICFTTIQLGAGLPIHRLLIFGDSDPLKRSDRDWKWADIPYFVVLAAFCGWFAALWSNGRLYVWVKRRRVHRKMEARAKRHNFFRYYKVMEAVACAFLCACLCGLAPRMIQCTPCPMFCGPPGGACSAELEPHNISNLTEVVGHRRLENSSGSGSSGDHTGGHHCLSYVRYVCEPGEYDEMATLLLTNAEEATQHLFSREANPLRLQSLLLTMSVYTVLSMLVQGINVPMGSFVPAMLMGAIIGRTLGESVQEQGFLSDPGLYAIVGSASMLAGVTHFTVAIVMLLVEGSHDLNMVSPMMIGIFVAHLMARLVHHHAYDERLIMKKKVPFLDAEMTETMDTSGLCAGDLMDTVPEKAQLSEFMSIDAVRDALELERDGQKLVDFPVIDENHTCIGITRASRLKAILRAYDKSQKKGSRDSALGNAQTSEMQPINAYKSAIWEDTLEDRDQGVETFLEGVVKDSDPLAVPVYRTMDSTPYAIMESLPVPRLYPLFIRAHCVVACVLSSSGYFKGLVTRHSLISAALAHDAHNHAHHEDEDEDSDGEDDEEDWETFKAKKHIAPIQRPRTHSLPAKVMLQIIFGTVVILVLTNFGMVLLDGTIVNWKFNTMHDIVEKNGVGLGALFLMAVAMSLAGLASVIVIWVYNVCEIAGSGIPEAKGFINGNHISKFFNPWGHCARVLSMVLAAASGFPIGREGPMVAIGGTTGYAVARTLAAPYARHYVARDWDDSAGGGAALLSIDEERYAHVKLQGFILGAASGIAAAFSAPIGGILYLFEEVTVTSWPPGFMFYIFTACAMTVVLSRLLMNAMGQSFHRFLIFSSTTEGHEVYQFIDIPFFIILGAIVGSCSALYSKGLFLVWNTRRKLAKRWMRYQPYARIAETILYAGLVALVVSIVPLMVGCHESMDSLAGGHGSSGASSSAAHGSSSSHGSNSGSSNVSSSHSSISSNSSSGADHSGAQHRLLSGDGGHGFTYVQYTCPDGYYNEVATLLVTAWEGAIKHLFSPQETGLTIGSLSLCLVTYTLLAMGMPGLQVPMGSFIPSMFIGAIMGRIMGTALHLMGLPTSNSGLYAVVGSGAFLGGFTHMTIAIVVLLVEASHDLSLTNPTMIGIFVGRMFSQLISPHAYDEVLIMAKGVPFLDAELPAALEGSENTAYSICKEIPERAILPEEANVEVLKAALLESDVSDFPIVDHNHVCLGTITYARLKEAVRIHEGAKERRQARPSFSNFARAGTMSFNMTKQKFGRFQKTEDAELQISRVISKVCQATNIRVCRIMDPTPYTVLQEMPLSRFLLLFTKVGAHKTVVMNKYAGFVGIITKRDLISAMQSVSHGHGHHHATEELADTPDSDHDDDDQGPPHGKPHGKGSVHFQGDGDGENSGNEDAEAGSKGHDGSSNGHSSPQPPLPPPHAEPEGRHPHFEQEGAHPHFEQEGADNKWEEDDDVPTKTTNRGSDITTPAAKSMQAPARAPAVELRQPPAATAPVDYVMNFFSAIPRSFTETVQNCGGNFGQTTQRAQSNGVTDGSIVPRTVIGAHESRPRRIGG